ncbi:MAG: hypothetical protein ACRBBU_01620 [Pseudooceanicola sp.]
MKNVFGAVAVAMLLSAPVSAGSLADPIIEEAVIVETTTSSSSGQALVLFVGVLLATVVVAN